MAMINMQQSLKDTCIKAIAQNIHYRKSRNLKKKSQGPKPSELKNLEQRLTGAG